MDLAIASELCEVLQCRLTELDFDKSFIQNGGQSLSAAALVTKCEARGWGLTSHVILTSETIRDAIDSAQPIGQARVTVQPDEKVVSSPQLQGHQANNSFSRGMSFKNTNFLSELDAYSHEDLEAISSFDRTAFEEETSPGSVISLDESSMPSSANWSSRPSSAVPSAGDHDDDDYDHNEHHDDNHDVDDGPTEIQLSLVHGTLKTPGTNMIVYAETFHARDIPKLKMAWKTVIEAEEIFQAKALGEFLSEDWIAFDWNDQALAISSQKSLRGLPVENRIGSFLQVMPYKKSKGQSTLFTIVWTIHHAFIDGHSASIVLDKVRRAAAGMHVKPGPPFSRLAKDLKRLRQSQREKGDAYWQRKNEEHKSAKSQLLLPFVDIELGKGSCSEVVLSIESLQDEIHDAAKAANVTPATLLNAAWAVILTMYSDSDSVAFGAILSGRDLALPGVTEVVGPLINSLPFFVTVNRQLSVREFLRSVFRDMLELRDLQWTTPENGFSRHFESALSVQLEDVSHPEGSIRPIQKPYKHQATDIPLSIVIEKDIVRFSYHCSRFSRRNMNGIKAAYHEALKSLLDLHASMGIVMQSLLPCPSLVSLMKHGNCLSGRTTKPSITQDLVTLFEKSAKDHPEAISIEQRPCLLKYKDLDRAAGRLAVRLKSLISEDDVICVHSDRSPNWIVAIYGILKASGVYCSLDVGLPSDLRNSIYSSAGAKVFLTPSRSQMSFCPTSCEMALAVEDVLNETDELESAVMEHRAEPKPWSPAYLCFTSGSTGRPKGVICAHEGLVAFQSDLEVRLFAQPGVKISQIMSPAFDGSIHELFSSLSYGATLVLPSSNEPFDHMASVDSALITPSIARALDPKSYERLKYVYLVGEPVPQIVNDKWATHKSLYNMYGPTEGTCGATIKQLSPGTPVTIGGPNPTTRIYILDSRRSLVPPGVIGEIYLAGVQVAKGYIHLPDVTKERFLPDSICRNGEQMYKTGDRGYWNEAGEIVCLGRSDRQIKLRGYRLDMNDIEVRIARAAPEIEAVAVAPQGDILGAMVQPASTNIRSLQQKISAVLPPYAIPQNIIPIDKLPTTGSGKIDYAAISQKSNTYSKRAPQAPRTSTEKAVAEAFRSLLDSSQTRSLFVDSNFIQLGGHSLQQVSLSLRLTKKFGIRIPLRLIIEHPTLGDLAESIEKFQEMKRPETLTSESLSSHKLSPVEDEWLQKYGLNAGLSAFNVAFASRFDETVGKQALTEAWNTVLARHRLLRCCYVNPRGKQPSRVYRDLTPQVERVRHFDLWTEINRPFCLDRSAPIRVSITDNMLVVVLSHIVADYTTLSILLREVSAVYSGQELLPVGHEYHDTSFWSESPPPCYLDFWTKYLAGCAITPPLLGREVERKGYQGTSIVSYMDSATAQSLFSFTEFTKITLQQMATAAVATCVQLESSETDVVIGNPYVNRNSEEDFETVGLFLTPLPIRVKFDPLLQPSDGEEKDSFIQAVQKSSQAALAHTVPWHQLLEHLAINPSYPDHPLSDVMVTFHDNRRSIGLDISAPGFEPCFLWSQGAKFKLMCEFTALTDSKLLLRLEFDPECVGPSEARRIQALIPQALSLLMQDIPHHDVKRTLREYSTKAEEETSFVAREFFGKRLCDF